MYRVTVTSVMAISEKGSSLTVTSVRAKLGLRWIMFGLGWIMIVPKEKHRDLSNRTIRRKILVGVGGRVLSKV